MGCASSLRVMDSDQATKDVEKQLEELALADERHFKILLLGAGESGKSTVVKQVKMIYKGGGVSAKEKEEYAQAIKRNVIESIQTLIEARETVGVSLTGGEEASAAMERLAALTPDDTLTPQAVDDTVLLWENAGMQEVWKRRSEYWCLDATPYYLSEARRLADPELDPTDEDMIMTRTRTTGIIVTEFTDHPYTFSLVDVGGQRSERRKWMHCFDDVKAVIFLVGLSGYHQVLFEDNSVNRMHESLNLFKEVAGNPIFEKTPMFVFLNKKDLFEEMITSVSLKKCFTEYDGPDGESMPALRYIEKKYKEAMLEKVPGKDVNVHIIAARVRMDMKIAFGEVKDEIRHAYATQGGRSGSKSRFDGKKVVEGMKGIKMASPKAALDKLRVVTSPLPSR